MTYENSQKLFSMINDQTTPTPVVTDFMTLIGKDYNIFYKDSETGYNLLMVAARTNRFLVFETFYNQQPQLIHEVDTKGNNILCVHMLSCDISWKFMRFYKAANVNINHLNHEGLSIFEFVITHLRDEPRYTYKRFSFMELFKESNLPKQSHADLYCFFAASKGLLAGYMVTRIHTLTGTSLNTKNRNGTYPLHHIVKNNISPSVTHHLLDLGADPTLKDDHGFTAIEYVPLEKLNASYYLGALCRHGANPFLIADKTPSKHLNLLLTRLRRRFRDSSNILI